MYIYTCILECHAYKNKKYLPRLKKNIIIMTNGRCFVPYYMSTASFPLLFFSLIRSHDVKGAH